jgi:sirohydrochlorin cobaltochelatase
MRRLLLLLLLVPLLQGLLVSFWPGTAESAMKKDEQSPRKAILLVAFGTSIPEAAKAFDEIEKVVREKYRDIEVRWAFTSQTIRARLAAQGKNLDSPETALSRLMSEGYTQAAVLSLHVVPGEEFHDLQRNAMHFADMSGGFEKVMVARPLLGNYDDMTRVADILMRRFRPQREDEGVIFIGHGNSTHPSDAIYVAMNSLMNDRDARLFVGSVEGHPTQDQILPKLNALRIRKVRLIPLMTIAGDHVRKDIAGDAPDSWKSVLSKNGIDGEPLFSGLAQNPEIVAIWLDHLEDIVSKMK